eukprot:361697-Chlamydomonas_euryale.AAC.6
MDQQFWREVDREGQYSATQRIVLGTACTHETARCRTLRVAVAVRAMMGTWAAAVRQQCSGVRWCGCTSKSGGVAASQHTSVRSGTAAVWRHDAVWLRW